MTVSNADDFPSLRSNPRPSIAWKAPAPAPYSPGAGNVEALRVIAEVLVQIAGELTQIRGAFERGSIPPAAMLRNDPRLDPLLRDALDEMELDATRQPEDDPCA